MSEENKNQQQTQGDTQQPLLAGKYKSKEELEKGYLELQKKLGDRQQPAKAQEPNPDTQSKDDEYAWKQKNAAYDAKQNMVKARKKEASDALVADGVLGAVRRALGNADSIAKFEKDFDDGLIGAGEVQRLAQIGGMKPENPKTIPDDQDDTKKQAEEAEINYMMRMLQNSESAYFNQAASDHKHVVAKVNEIKSRIGAQ